MKPTIHTGRLIDIMSMYAENSPKSVDLMEEFITEVAIDFKNRNQAKLRAKELARMNVTHRFICDKMLDEFPDEKELDKIIDEAIFENKNTNH